MKKAAICGLMLSVTQSLWSFEGAYIGANLGGGATVGRASVNEVTILNAKPFFSSKFDTDLFRISPDASLYAGYGLQYCLWIAACSGGSWS